MKVGIVAPHIFMQDDILPHVIFSPGWQAIALADALTDSGVDVTLYTPGGVTTKAKNITADMSLFEAELHARDDTYLDLLKKHPLTFISLARQVQSEIISRAFSDANANKIDIVHIYMNEEDIALPFAQFCSKATVFTHHDPFSFLVKYRSIFPKYSHLNWLSMSLAQRDTMPEDTNWVGNIYHGLSKDLYVPHPKAHTRYIAYIGRIIEPKGLHLAIEAIKLYNAHHPKAPYVLKIAGKHYSGEKDSYWQNKIKPYIDDKEIIYCGFISGTTAKNDFLAQASALIIPSLFSEPFGMVMIEALASGTPIIGLNRGAIPEVISEGKTGFIVNTVTAKTMLNTQKTAEKLAHAIENIPHIDTAQCRADFEARFTLEQMADGHKEVYKKLMQ